MSILSRKPLVRNFPTGKTTKYADVANNVYVTTNYDLFGHIEGNRRLSKPHYKRLKESFMEKQIPSPIIVDETYKICDGQNRFEVCKELGLPIYYIIIPELSLPDVQRLNANTKTWNTDDYLESYCELGIKDYLVYRSFKAEYKFGHEICRQLLGGSFSSNKKTSEHTFKTGRFKIQSLSRAIDIAKKLAKVGQYYDGYKRKCFIWAMLRLFKTEEYNHDTFLHRLSMQTEKMQDQTNTESYLKLIEKLYNFRSKNKVRLFTY